MKSAIFTLAFVAASLFASAQCTPTTLANPGLFPEGDSAVCFVNGEAKSATVYFKNFEQVTLGPITADVDSIRFDDIVGLPAGITWTTNNAANGNIFVKNEEGCIQLSGTSSCINEGVYKLDSILVTAWINGLTQGVQQPASAIGLYMVVKTVNAGTDCSTVTDTIAGCTVGLNEVANNVGRISSFPNPFNDYTNISFNANNSAVYTLNVVNMLGAVVYTEQVVAEPGQNNIRVERGNLPAGVYVYSISNGSHSVNNRMVIGQ